MEIRIRHNAEKNGLEIKFEGIPGENVRKWMKSHGFRWSKFFKHWWAKDSQQRRDALSLFAKRMEGCDAIELIVDEMPEFGEDPQLAAAQELDLVFGGPVE